MRRHPKRKKSNLFKDVGLIDDRADLGFLMEPEIGKTISRSTKIFCAGSDIHASFQFVFDEDIHGEELTSRLKLHPDMQPHLRKHLLLLIEKYFCMFIKKNTNNNSTLNMSHRYW